MPHWLTVTLAVLTPLAAWRWVLRPLRRFARDALTVLGQIRASAAGLGALTLEVRALAGSIVTLAAALLTDQQSLRNEHAELRDKHHDLADLVVELDADFRRIETRVQEHMTDERRHIA